MPPSSRRSLRNRGRDVPDAPQSDADTPDSIATPSRKRRRPPQLNGTQEAAAAAEPPRARITESVASNDSNTTLPNAGDLDNPQDPIERQNLVIASLRTPRDYTPNAVVDYANDLQARRTEGRNIAAFAKIAARDWCFFVQDTKVLIGRADAVTRPAPASHQPDLTGLPMNESALSQWGVHIDLGPERQVSRVHAEINFNPSDQTWYIMVNSRNGLKLDDRSLTKGAHEPLHSGICIGILGTQMLFLLANQEDDFHPMLWRQVKNEDAAESDNDSHPPPKTHHAHPSGPTPKREQYDPFPPSSHPRHKQQSSQAYYNQMTSTPGRGPPGTPLTFRNDNDPRSKGSPATFLEGTIFEGQDNIDYSHDAAKDIKPPYSYAQLIGQAILSSSEEMLTLNNIYEYIKTRYAYFRHTTAGWQNSIRHNLSLNKSFEKVARRTDEPGKGMKWKIADPEREDFIKKQMHNPRKGGGVALGARMDGSGPSSPALGSLRDATSQATERLMGALEHDYRSQGRVKSPPRSATPPLSSVPMATESYTPDRGPRPYGDFKQSPKLRDHHSFVTPAKRFAYGNDSGHDATYIKTDDQKRHLESSPMVDPVKPSVSGLKGEAANSPPTLYSDNNSNMYGNQDSNRMNHALVTPLVTRHAPRLAPPSTAQMPSQYMNFSSPAPFWKFIDLPSTPARGPLDLSPIKLQRPDEKDDNDNDNDNDDPAQPSSPPMLNEDESAEPEDEVGENEDNKPDDDEDVGPESPSRTVSRPVSRRDIGPPRSRSNSNVNGFAGGMVRGASLTSFEEEAEGEEESYDLSK
ncbi:hypothetical protein CC86DRAFT_295898 [Ophiobolus disseminans]|uniref:Uncharacterized protein n=1 Tax=Ophiobolus disseminans TaxID=1469910 RepID=A0A6A6ZVC6_9PLEO|nr:hypothetical protein CC86DRAFT_295898 [Ophiobolus disseminans]